jgi:hypothetical protein
MFIKIEVEKRVDSNFISGAYTKVQYIRPENIYSATVTYNEEGAVCDVILSTAEGDLHIFGVDLAQKAYAALESYLNENDSAE